MGKNKHKQQPIQTAHTSQPIPVKIVDEKPAKPSHSERMQEVKTKTAENKVRRDSAAIDKKDIKNERNAIENDRRAQGAPKHGFTFQFFKRTHTEALAQPKRPFLGFLRRGKGQQGVKEQPRDEHGRFMAKQSTFDDIAPPKPQKRDPRDAFADKAVVPYKTETVTVKGRKYKIPVDDNGKVPPSAIAARFLAVKEGTGKAQKRNVVLDHNQDAKEILPLDITPEQLKEWWAAPNTRDVEGIDNKDPSIFDVIGIRAKGAIEAHGKIAVDGTPEQQEILRSVIADCFTVKEQKALVKKGGVVVHIDDLPDGYAAIYQGKKDGMSFQITVDPKYVKKTDDSFLHELVHHSRLVDDDREGVLMRSRSSDESLVVVLPDDVSLEEAATVLETLARHTPYDDPEYPSYHGYVGALKGKDPFELIRKDRELVAGSAAPGSKGLRGKRAKNAVKTNFDKSEIKDLVITHVGPKSAKDRLDELTRDKK